MQVYLNTSLCPKTHLAGGYQVPVLHRSPKFQGNLGGRGLSHAVYTPALRLPRHGLHDGVRMGRYPLSSLSALPSLLQLAQLAWQRLGK